MKWSRLVLAVVLLVGFASVASAESAWVLWSQYWKIDVKPTGKLSDFGIKLWEVQNAFEKRQQCLGKLERYISSLETLYEGKKPADVTRDEYAGRKRLHVRSDKQKEILSAACLPETVDPREKK